MTVTCPGAPAPFAGAEAPGTTVGCNAGAYSVSESGPAGYTQSSSAGCSGTLTVGQTANCTITNNDNPCTLTVTKILINDNGGTATVGSFTLRIDGIAVTSGAPVPVSCGAHTVSEDNPGPGYTSTIGGDCAANGSVTLSAGQSKACTITNNDVASPSSPTITPSPAPVTPSPTPVVNAITATPSPVIVGGEVELPVSRGGAGLSGEETASGALDVLLLAAAGAVLILLMAAALYATKRPDQ
jgi:hypothetical protein